MNVVSLLTATVVLTTAFSVFGQTQVASTPTPLPQLLAEAGANNPQISSADHGARAAKQVAPQVTTLPDPKFTNQQLSVGSPKPFAGYKRGEPLPINQALNRPRAKLGLDLSAWMVIVFVTVTVFLAGFRIVAIFSFPMLSASAWLIVRKHPKMFQLWGLSLNQKSYYDPRRY
jgi:type IV secretory pathway VirB3-like protein